MPYVFYDIKEYTCQNIYPNKLFVLPIFRSYFECFQKSGFYPKILSCVEMYLLKIRSEVRNPHISASRVSFEI